MITFTYPYQDPDTLEEIPLEISFTAYPEDPGHLTGLPENCYPPEPATIEIESVTAPEGKDLFDFDCSLSFDAEINQACWDEVARLKAEAEAGQYNEDYIT